MSRLVTGVHDAQRQGGKKQQSWGLLREFAASGISVGCANTVLNPVEVVKIRMHLASAGNAVPPTAAKAALAALPAPAASFTPPAAAMATAAASSSSSAGSSTAALYPSSARFFSHTTAYRGVSAQPPAAAAGAAPSVLLPTPQAAAAASAAASSSSSKAAAASAEHALAASLQAATAAITHPVQHSSSSISSALSGFSSTTKRPGFVATAGTILREEGPTGFTRGIQASATRAVLNGGIRLGLYDPIKTLMSADGSGSDLHMGLKLAAGSISGGIGAVATTPIELAKTRLQAPSATTRSMSVVLRGVVEQQGVQGLWRGATPSVLRLILLNSSMVATYDEVKGRIKAFTGFSGLPLVLSSSMVAGLVTTTVINPADVARSYMQTGRGSSLVGVVRGILKREGPRGFFKGWTAAYARTGPQTLIIFSVSELVRPLFGLNVIGGSSG